MLEDNPKALVERDPATALNATSVSKVPKSASSAQISRQAVLKKSCKSSFSSVGFNITFVAG